MSDLHLTSAAADAAVTAGSGTKWKAAPAAGASATHVNRNSVAGPTAPLQMTDGAAGVNGTAVSWYSGPLQAVTIAGAITCSLWTRENATTNNVAPTIRIERCDGTGAVLSTIVAETTNHGAGECATTAGGASDTISVTAANVTDTTLADGDRLRITLWIDDAADQGGSGSMASGGQGEAWVNGPVGSQGQARLAFTENLDPVGTVSFKGVHSATGVSSAADADGDLTVACTVPAGTTLAVICWGVGAPSGDGGGTAQAITAMTFNGVACQDSGLVVHENGSTNGFLEVWYILNPTSGNLVITSPANGQDLLCNVVYYGGADAPTGFSSATGSGGTQTINETAQTTGKAAALYGQGAPAYQSAGTFNQTKRFGLDLNSSSAGGNFGYQDMAGTGSSAALSFTPVSPDWWAAISFEIPAAAPSAPSGAPPAIISPYASFH